MSSYNKIVIGVDQSYTRTGISIAVDGKLVKVTSIPFKGCQTKSDKRKLLANILNNIIGRNLDKCNEMVILCERIRTFSHHDEPDKQDKSKPAMFISTDYIKATGALIATIVDTAYDYKVPVFSVDTRSWKSRIVGKCKGNKQKGNKFDTIKHVKSLGFDVSSTNKKGKVIYDDDAADSACIALYGFLNKSDQVLKEEK